MNKFTISDFDREIWESELADFVPEKIFDAHTHLWNDRFASASTEASALRFNADLAVMREFAGQVFPGRETHFLLMGTPMKDIDFAGDRRWLCAEAAKDPQSAAGVLVTSQLQPEILADEVDRYHIKALKPYRIFAVDPANCDIVDYLPEALIEVADHYKLVVVLHLSKFTGAADEKNLADLTRLTAKYPGVTWQLAHCARGFNPFTLEKSIHRLKHLDHICYDTSAVCDTYSHFLLLKHEDRKRIMFGSDNIAAGGEHGKYITWGRAWEFFPGITRPHCDSRSTLVVYEQLRCQRQAAMMLELSDDDIQDLFYRNAQHIISGK